MGNNKVNRHSLLSTTIELHRVSSFMVDDAPGANASGIGGVSAKLA